MQDTGQGGIQQSLLRPKSLPPEIFRWCRRRSQSPRGSKASASQRPAHSVRFREKGTQRLLSSRVSVPDRSLRRHWKKKPCPNGDYSVQKSLRVLGLSVVETTVESSSGGSRKSRGRRTAGIGKGEAQGRCLVLLSPPESSSALLCGCADRRPAPGPRRPPATRATQSLPRFPQPDPWAAQHFRCIEKPRKAPNKAQPAVPQRASTQKNLCNQAKLS